MNRLKKQKQVIELITDVDLSQLFEASPERGLEVLMDMYMGLVYTIVQSKLYSLYSREDIDECVSDVFLEAFAKRKDLVNLEKGSIKAYLAVLARRRAIDLHRRLVKTATNIEYMEEEAGECPVDSYTPEDALVERESQRKLVEAIFALGEPDSEIFIRRYYLEQRTKEISKLVHLKESAINTRLSRGLAKLKKLLGGEENAR